MLVATLFMIYNYYRVTLSTIYGEFDLKNSTTLRIAHSILYNLIISCKHTICSLLRVLNYKNYFWTILGQIRKKLFEQKILDSFQIVTLSKFKFFF